MLYITRSILLRLINFSGSTISLEMHNSLDSENHFTQKWILNSMRTKMSSLAFKGLNEHKKTGQQIQRSQAVDLSSSASGVLLYFIYLFIYLLLTEVILFPFCAPGTYSNSFFWARQTGSFVWPGKKPSVVCETPNIITLMAD